jgi:hypothetical protein
MANVYKLTDYAKKGNVMNYIRRIFESNWGPKQKEIRTAGYQSGV